MKNRLISPNGIRNFNINTELSLASNQIQIIVTVEGELAEYIFPKKSKQKRANELWKATCFELFLANSEKEAYYELNFSSSLSWNFYSLKTYRADVEEVKFMNEPKIETYQNNDAFQISFHLETEAFSFEDFDVYNVACIVLNKNNERTFWSVKHQTTKADFHERQNFLKIT